MSLAKAIHAFCGKNVLHRLIEVRERSELLGTDLELSKPPLDEWLTVSIKQMYGGHAKQAGLIASQCHAGAYANRWVVVVDDDIDPANVNDVIWSMCTRFDPREDMEVLRGNWSTHLDPMVYSHDDRRNARLVIDACTPWVRKDEFPQVARSSRELDERIKAKFAEFLPPSA